MPDRGSDAGADLEVPGIDPATVGRLIGQTGLRVEMLSRGKSNLTYRVWNDAGEWVVRRPPLGHVLETAHDMAREYRILTALRDTPVPAPVPLVLCDDPDVTGAPFYVMELVHGLVTGAAPPAGYADSDEDRRRMSEGFIATLAAIHAVDWRAAGLEGFGRPDGYLERQVRRWARQWEGNKTRDLPGVEELGRRLGRAVPAQAGSTIVHGDYSLNNVMLALDDPGRVVAVLDWEMSTLGDPLADVGWVMAFWPRAGGFPSTDEVVGRYAALSGRSVENVSFYVALAHYKMAVIGEGIHARFLKGATVGDGFAEIGAGVTRNIDAGLAALPAS